MEPFSNKLIRPQSDQYFDNFARDNIDFVQDSEIGGIFPVLEKCERQQQKVFGSNSSRLRTLAAR